MILKSKSIASITSCRTALTSILIVGLTTIFVLSLTNFQYADGQLSLFADKLPTFVEFKKIYGKIYASPQEDARRESIFKKTVAKIDKHNKLYNSAKATYALYPCEYSDMDEQEVATFLKGLVLPDDVLSPEEFNKTLAIDSSSSSSSTRLARRQTNLKPNPLATKLPDELDYRKTGCVSLPKNQKFCGSCWAFAATSAIETMKCLKTGRLETMSEQQLVDCAKQKHGYKSFGCSGGIFSEAFRYIQENGGLDDDECYPYGSNDLSECRYNPKCKVGSIASWRRIAPNEDSLKEALVKYGPVVAAIHTNDDFFSYK